MRSTDEVYWNFKDYGYPHWLPVTVHEMNILYHGARDMMQGRRELVIRAMIDATHDRLQAQALTGVIDPEWISTAVMLIAMRGLLGDQLPDHAWDIT